MRIEPKTLADGGIALFSQRSICVMYDCGNGVSQHVMRGIARQEFAEHVIADGKQQIKRHDRCAFFVDGSEAMSMESDFREPVVNWIKNEPRVEVHILVKPGIKGSLMQMAANTANLLLGRTIAKVYTDVGEWVVAGKKEASRFRRQPIPETFSP